MEEKRKYPRIKKKIKSEVHSNEGMTFSTSGDLSNGGIFISTPEPVKVGSEIQLSIKIPDGNEIDIQGIVRWISETSTEDRRAGMGIEFVELTQDQKKKLSIITAD